MDPEPSSDLFIEPSLFTGIVFLLLLFLQFLTAASSVAFMSLNSHKADELKDDVPGKRIRLLLEKPRKLSAAFSAFGILLLMATALLGYTMLEFWFSNVADGWRFLLQVAVLSLTLLFFADLLPKSMAARNPVVAARRLSGFVAAMNFVLTPVSIPLREMRSFLTRSLESEPKGQLSVNQLSQALELTSNEGTSQEEQKILEGIVSFGNTETRQVMTPRIDIFAIDSAWAFSEIVPQILSRGYSRIPVYKDNIDHIVGVLFVKDLIPHIGKPVFDWTGLLREAFFVPENKKLDNLLKDFQAMKNHLAVVVDEYGGTSGIVTLEDVIEEIVGDISDEFDEESSDYQQKSDNEFVFEAKTGLKDFFRIIDADESAFEDYIGESETLGGFLLELFGDFPKRGDSVSCEQLHFVVEETDSKRIVKIKVTVNHVE